MPKPQTSHPMSSLFVAAKACARYSALGLAALLTACSQPSEQNWKSVGKISDGLRTKFVEVTREKAQDRETYEAAVASLCKGERICVVGFFLPGDRIPPSSSSKQFLANGGWKPYSPAAVWWSNTNTGATGFTKWDCARAGEAGAPLDALCGNGVKEAYQAILSMAARAGMAQACKWPTSNAASVAAAHIANISDPRRQAFTQKAYDGMYASSLKGPNDPADCKRLRPKMEEKAKQAQTVLAL